MFAWRFSISFFLLASLVVQGFSVAHAAKVKKSKSSKSNKFYEFFDKATKVFSSEDLDAISKNSNGSFRERGVYGCFDDKNKGISLYYHCPGDSRDEGVKFAFKVKDDVMTAYSYAVDGVATLYNDTKEFGSDFVKDVASISKSDKTKSNKVASGKRRAYDISKIDAKNFAHELKTKGKSIIYFNYARITFATGKELRQVQYKVEPKIKQLAAYIKKNLRNKKLKVEGHGDRARDESYNIKLSMQRAIRVRDLLVKYGVPFGKIEVNGFGNKYPMVEEDNKGAGKFNRRVAIYFSK